MEEIVIATSNEGKLREIRHGLADLPLILRSITEFPGLTKPSEDSESFEENALHKARHIAVQLGKWTLADDSGLEVTALDGKPGVHSARYAGPNASDEDNNKLLLSELASIPNNRRQARFVCVIAVVDPLGNSLVVKGCCNGEILEAPRGHDGFGYDPLFLVPEEGKTFAELGPVKKDAISHRGRALADLRRKLPNFIGK